MGPSGCGKTTILNMISGFIEPTQGEIFVDGRQLNNVPVEKRSIGMVFQNYALFPHMTVFDNVAFGLKMRKLIRDEVQEKVRRVLELVRLKGFETRYPQQLSGGQQQRIALARSLVIQPELLLLDEPLGALDKKLREEMQVELKELQKRLGVTTLFVTHDQEEALTLSTRIAVMRGGKIIQVGTPTEVYEGPKNHFVSDFIGTSNFFHGQIIGNGKTLDTSIGLCISIPRRLPVGESVEVAIRPEKIKIVMEQPVTETNYLPATLSEIIYLGTNTHFYLNTQIGTRMVVYQQNLIAQGNSSSLRPGDRVYLEWSEDNVLILEREQG